MDTSRYKERMMKAFKRMGGGALAAAVISTCTAMPAYAAVTATDSPSSPAMARANIGGGGESKPVYPPSSPSSVNESAPATTGPASTPTQGQGQSAPAPKQEGMNRLPKVPSSGGREPGFHARQ